MRGPSIRAAVSRSPAISTASPSKRDDNATSRMPAVIATAPIRMAWPIVFPYFIPCVVNDMAYINDLAYMFRTYA